MALPDGAVEHDELPLVVEAASGERLLFRDVGPDDVPGLANLYRSLDAEATYRRFFTAAPPGEQFFEHLVSIAERGGCSVVVVDLNDGSDAAPIVAEADVEPLANGNGELAMTIASSWRGWLGPYLLGLLRRRVAGLGIPNLEAEILTCNRPMRALARRSGQAQLPQSDWETVRVAFASEGPAPSWPRTSRPRVLVELRSMNVDALAELVAAGYEVMTCTGRRSGAPPCPMTTGTGDCPLARDADLVVVALADPDDRRDLLAAHRDKHPDTPVVALEPSTGRPFTGDELVATVDRAVLDGAPHRSGGT